MRAGSTRKKYYKFTPYAGGCFRALNGKLFVGIGVSYRDIPPNKKGSTRGVPPSPDWLENLGKAVKRDIDDARTSLKGLDFHFNVKAGAIGDLDRLIQPSTAKTSTPKSKTGVRSDELIRRAIGYRDRAIRDGGNSRKKIAGVNKKVQLTRGILENLRRDIAAANPTIQDHEVAKIWYRRLVLINKMYLRGQRLYSIGRDLARKYPRKEDLNKCNLVSLLTNNSGFSANENIHLLCLCAYSSGVNPAELWFEWGNLYSMFEMFASYGRITHGAETALDAITKRSLYEFVFNIPPDSDSDSDMVVLRKSLQMTMRTLIFDYPARAHGLAMPLPKGFGSQDNTIADRTIDVMECLFPRQAKIDNDRRFFEALQKAGTSNHF